MSSAVAPLPPLPPEAVAALAALTPRMTRLETDGVDELAALLARYPDHPGLVGHTAGALASRGDHAASLAITNDFFNWRRDRLRHSGVAPIA